MATPPERDRSVFINCPFDDDYRAIFDAILFAVLACRLEVRSALEIVDSGESRLQKILRLIAATKFSFHDISRVQLDDASGLPRFNMPIELGIALGVKHLGRAKLRAHHLLVLDTERFRYQTFASDLAGVDISSHGDIPDRAIAAVRDFIATHSSDALPSASVIVQTHRNFEAALPDMVTAAEQRMDEWTFHDRLRHMNAFLKRMASS